MSQSESSDALLKKKRHRITLLFQGLVILGILAIVWFSFGRNVLAPQKDSEAPGRLGNMELLSSVGGSEALAQVSNLHGMNIDLMSAYIAQYGHQNEHAMVWVAQATNDGEAANLVDRMIAAIGRGGAPFTNPRKLSVSGQQVVQVDGPDGRHFFYSSGKKTIWISTTSPDALGFLEQAVKSL